MPRLLDDGHRVRVLTRDAGKVAARDWRDRVEVVEGDASSAEALGAALDGVDVAYYLLHSMDGRPGFVERDRELAATLRPRPPATPGVGRIVYMSGLHPHDGRLSEHLASRVEVGEILMRSGVPTAVLQAAVIIGSGSASFEMLRQLTRRLPAMLTPKWLDNRIQPIARSRRAALPRPRPPTCRRDGQPHLRRRRSRRADLPRDDPALRRRSRACAGG